MTALSVPFSTFRFFGEAPGPHLLVLGAVHGNEQCGPLAIRQMISELESGKIKIKAGTVTFIPVTNPKAYAMNTREGDRNLNRNLGPYETEVDFEDKIANALTKVMADCDVLLDLHSFKATGDEFIFVGPEDNQGALQPFAFGDEELRFAQVLGIDKMVFGWLDSYDDYVTQQNEFLDKQPTVHPEINRADRRFGIGTTEYFRSLGRGYAVTVECGNHTDPKAHPIAYRAIRGALAYLGLTAGAADYRPQPFTQSYEFFQITLRHHEDDRFPEPWQLFQPVKKGQVLGIRHNGETIAAPEDGAMIFTDATAKVGEAWIYFARVSERGKN